MGKKLSHRVVTFLDRQELDFLDAITKDILFSKGIKIPRSTLLRIMIDIFVLSENQNIKTHDDLVSMVLEKLEKGEKCLKKFH